MITEATKQLLLVITWREKVPVSILSEIRTLQLRENGANMQVTATVATL